MRNFSTFVAALILAGSVLSANAQSPAHKTYKSPTQIPDAVYAACTAKVLKTLGPPPGLAAHFQDNWVAFAYMCAKRGDGTW